ncbi:MAG: hypothetical protein KBS99_04820 [Prevotellaceae bacterium]|nr:hypothetical protein [Candidatus Colivivens caballi]
MKKNVKLIISIIAIIFVGIFTACGGVDSTNKKSNGGTTPTGTNTKKALNVSIYLDLSDRLEREMSPSQSERDIEIVMYMAAIVKSHAVSQKIVPSTDRIKVFFYPSPNDSKINLLSQDLELDLGKAQPSEKKKLLNEFEAKFESSLSQIYETTLAQKNWIGSDIWGFFKKQVDTYCIKEEARNIIVILTDGYIFDTNNKQIDGDNYSYILPQTLQNPKSGLIVSRQGLKNLEVLMLEVNPYDPKHQDQMESIITNWFQGMEIQNSYVGMTDQPSNTKLIIDKFMK